MADKINYTEKDRLVCSLVKDTNGLSIAEMSEKAGVAISAGSITSAIKKGLIEKLEEREVMRPGVKKVNTYHFDGVGDEVKLTEKETEIVNALDGHDEYFTLADLAKIMNREKMSSGSINGLVKKGVLSKGDELELPTSKKATIGIYGWVADPVD